MPFLITDAAAPLLMDTVPALKLTCFSGHPARDEVYAYLRCYVCRGALHFCFTEFDEAPPDDVRFGLALQPADETERYLLLRVAPRAGAQVTVRSAQGTAERALAAPAVQYTAGSDEQGIFWSAEGKLEASLLHMLFGKAMKAGAVWAGNVFLYRGSEAAFGAAFPVPEGLTAPTAEGFDTFTIVPY